MSKKVAKLVRVSLVTRVIVDVDATEQDIMELAVPKLSENLMDAPFENLEEIVDDTECPYEEAYLDLYGSVSDEVWKVYQKTIMKYSVDGINYHNNEHRISDTEDWSVNIRILKEDLWRIEPLFSYLETKEVIDDETHFNVHDRSDEVYDLLVKEYMSSDVVSGEMIYSTKIPLEFTEGDVREGIQTFLDWDDSAERFALERGDKHWVVKCI